MCDGDGQSCLGCDGAPFSGLALDACDECGGNNSTCQGCDGIMGSAKEFDSCGQCGGSDPHCLDPFVLSLKEGGGCIGSEVVMWWQAPSDHGEMRIKVNSTGFPCRLSWQGAAGAPLAPLDTHDPEDHALDEHNPPIRTFSTFEVVDGGFGGCGSACTQGWASFVASRGALEQCGLEDQPWHVYLEERLNNSDIWFAVAHVEMEEVQVVDCAYLKPTVERPSDSILANCIAWLGKAGDACPPPPPSPPPPVSPAPTAAPTSTPATTSAPSPSATPEPLPQTPPESNERNESNSNTTSNLLQAVHLVGYIKMHSVPKEQALLQHGALHHALAVAGLSLSFLIFRCLSPLFSLSHTCTQQHKSLLSHTHIYSFLHTKTLGFPLPSTPVPPPLLSLSLFFFLYV